MIVCTGPISSGTRLLKKIVESLRPAEDVVHHSMPQWEKFWDQSEFPPSTRYVIVTRRFDFTLKSAYAQGHGNPSLRGWKHLDHRLSEEELGEWIDMAMVRLASLPNAYWMTYEALIADTEQQCRNLAEWLGLTEEEWDKVDLPEVYDGNEKWR